MTVYYNGEFMEKEGVAISPDDRGFLFSDGVYEVIRAYGGRFFEAEAHFRRLEDGLTKMAIDYPAQSALPEIAAGVLAENDPVADVMVYIQITRGAAPRSHKFPPAGTTPTVYICLLPVHSQESAWQRGISAITAADTRWARCDIKSVGLLGNILAHQQAVEVGAEEAILVKDSVITEATHNSVFSVIDGTVRTAPLTNLILPSVTRGVVIELCKDLGLPLREFPFTDREILSAEEIFIAGTGSEVTGVAELDGREVGDSAPGPITRRLHQAFRERVSKG